MTIVSGIQPSGKLHVGNYLGAVKNWLALQKNAQNQCFFFLADWHSLTEAYDPKEKAAQIHELAAELLALDIDPKRVIFFRQSDLPEHLELAWYLACVTPVAEMERMTQYKDKTTRGQSPNTGLFTYPILMAADILAYASMRNHQEPNSKFQPVHVPVGHDQLQHIELTNDIAQWFNNRFGETFPTIKPILTPSARVMSLKDPTKKMSKSLGGDHCLFLDDPPEEVERKLRSAVTDTGPSNPHDSRLTTHDFISPGVQTLFEILEAFGDAGELARFRAAHDAGIIKYSELKPAVAKAFSTYFINFRKRKADILANPASVDAALTRGAEAARTIARATLDRVHNAVGIR
ncbi:MAG: tryptophan--tRNA ligase [Candidatus Uhrbacteria bacterium]